LRQPFAIEQTAPVKSIILSRIIFALVTPSGSR